MIEWARQRRERALEGLAALAALALYVVVVSRGEWLPVTGGTRSLAAPLLALLVVGLTGWRLRRHLHAAWHAGVVQRGLPWLLVVGLAGARQLLVAGLNRPAEPVELDIERVALAVIQDRLPLAGDLTTLVLGWLHAPVAAACYMAGVSAGLWQEIKEVPPEAVLPWSRWLHALLAVAAVWLLARTVARLAGPGAGLTAGTLLAIAGIGVRAGAGVDPGAPLALGLSLALWLVTQWSAVHHGAIWQRLPPLILWAITLACLAALWLPGWPATALAPLPAASAGAALAAWWSRRSWPAAAGPAGARTGQPRGDAPPGSHVG